MRWLARAPRVLGVALAGLAVTGCPHPEEVVTPTGAGKELAAEQIDRDPLALLPGGAFGLAVVDLQAVYASQFGQKLLGVLESHTPLPPSAGFDPKRDLTSLAVGVYSMSGANVVVIATGKFDPAAIEQAAGSTEGTPLGAPVVASSYAGRKLYTARNLGFVVLTPRTVLLGDETGIRRALDRIKEGRVSRRVPGWMEALLKTPNVPLVLGFNLRGQPLTESAREQLPFLQGLETARMLGNFQPPGMNVAGTLSYESETAAQAGAANVTALRELLKTYGFLMSLLGVSQPFQKLDARAQGSDAQFVAELDGRALDSLIDKASAYLGVPFQPKYIDATTTPSVGE
ncbi:MAG: hypothetical protein OZ928_17905 [Polyangiaceae bacterium]|nr:hypothetical protein [Polyangiaceae bacterium]